MREHIHCFPGRFSFCIATSRLHQKELLALENSIRVSPLWIMVWLLRCTRMYAKRDGILNLVYVRSNYFKFGEATWDHYYFPSEEFQCSINNRSNKTGPQFQQRQIWLCALIDFHILYCYKDCTSHYHAHFLLHRALGNVYCFCANQWKLKVKRKIISINYFVWAWDLMFTC